MELGLLDSHLELLKPGRLQAFIVLIHILLLNRARQKQEYSKLVIPDTSS